MNTWCIALCVLLAAPLAAAADEPAFVDVFVKGEGLCPAYRIPSVVVTNKGTVLAFAEGRQTLHDHAENDIVLRRGVKGGTTWDEMQMVHESGKDVLVNPCAVVLDSGRVLLMYQHFPAGYHARASGTKIKLLSPGIKGKTISRTLVTHSDDDGKTWSKPRDVTAGTKRPKMNSTASGPGVGIVLRRGEHKGRILMPTNEGWWEGKTRFFGVYAAYSDDGGETWKCGQAAPNTDASNGNEVQMVELADGSVLLNSRSHGGTKHRKVATSKDGGATWSALKDDTNLPEPQCMGSTLRLTWPGRDEARIEQIRKKIKSIRSFMARVRLTKEGAARYKKQLADLAAALAEQEAGGKSRILYIGPGSQKGRVDGTVRMSFDEGKTWPVAKMLYKGGYAYSCLTALPDGSVGVLFEKDGYKTITFARFTVDWLTEKGE